MGGNELSNTVGSIESEQPGSQVAVEVVVLGTVVALLLSPRVDRGSIEQTRPWSSQLPAERGWLPV